MREHLSEKLQRQVIINGKKLKRLEIGLKTIMLMNPSSKKQKC